ETKKSFDPSENKIIHFQAFGATNWALTANNNLSLMIEQKKVIFPSSIVSDYLDASLERIDIPIGDLHFARGQDLNAWPKKPAGQQRYGMMIEFAEHVGHMIKQTIQDTTLIEISYSGPNRNITFDLP